MSEGKCCNHDCNQGRAQKSCLVQIQEPAVNQQLTTEQEPVTWLLRRSAFRASPDGQDAEGHEWLEEADEPGQESSFPVYAAPVLAAQPAKSLMKRVDAAAEAMSEVMAHVNLGAWSVKFERALAGLRAVQETEPQAAPAAVAVADAVIAGPLFDFCGYLTMLPKESAITASGSHDASPMVEALKAWGEKRNLKLDDADVQGWSAALAATPAADAPDMVSVKKEDANNYCRILTALDMEEEGDPVAEVQRLLATPAPVVQPEPDAALLNQAIELLHALSGDERNRGNCSASEGAAASAYAVQRLAAALLAGVSAPAGDADTTTKEQYRRMFGAACEALGLINEALDLDPEDGGAEPILEAIAELKVKADAR